MPKFAPHSSQGGALNEEHLLASVYTLQTRIIIIIGNVIVVVL